MQVIKNFLRPTKVTWWVFGVLGASFLLIPVFLVALGSIAGEPLSFPLFPRFLFVPSLLMFGAWYALGLWAAGSVLLVLTFIFYCLSCGISKIWYALKNKRSNTGLVS